MNAITLIYQIEQKPVWNVISKRSHDKMWYMLSADHQL